MGRTFFGRKFDQLWDDDNDKNTMVLAMGLLLMESRGGSYTQQSNDEGVCGAPIMDVFLCWSSTTMMTT